MTLAEEITGLRPEDGKYALVEVETGKPPGEAAHRLAEFDEAGGVTIPPDTDFEHYVVYDRDGNTYTRGSWPDPFSEAPDEGPEEKADGADGLPDWMRRGGTNY